MGRFIRLMMLIVLLSAKAPAVELQETPIRAAMQRQVSLALIQDDFKSKLTNSSADDFSERMQQSENRSVLKAALYSALLPGGGEWYLGQRKRARYFFGVELISWIGYVSYKTYANWKEADFIRLASARASINLDDKNDEYRDWVGFFDSIDEFNRIGRVFAPERPYLQDTSENHWFWSDPEARRTYRHLKNRSREADRRAEFMIGAAVVNRIVSVIDAVITARSMRRRLDSDFSSKNNFKFDIRPFNQRRQVELTIFTGF